MDTEADEEETNSEEEESEEEESEGGASGQQMLVSSTLWGVMSPSGRRQAKHRLQSTPLTRGMHRQFRKELKLNLSNSSITEDSTVELTLRQKAIRKFFERDDIARPCPDIKRMVPDPEYLSKKIPVRFSLGTVKTLHSQYDMLKEMSHVPWRHSA